MAWLITGGAGFIGAHVVRDMLLSGRQVVVLDDMSTGSPGRVPPGVTVVRGHVGSRRSVRRALADTEVEIRGVLHLAGRHDAGESVHRPLDYWAQNVGGLEVLLEEMDQAEVRLMVHCSSAAVYGRGTHRTDARGRVLEDSPVDPVTPLGDTVLASERMLAAVARAQGWKALSLRCFNVAGAGAPELGGATDDSLVPRMLRALQEGRRPQVYGEDFPTPDGSCVRDWVHVADVAAAHVAAVRAVESAQLTAAATAEAGAAVRAATERVQSAAARAEAEARRLPGASLAAGVATGVPAAAEAASQAAARALERLPGGARAMGLAAHGLDEALRNSATEGVRDQVTEVAAQLGSLVARVAGADDGPRLVDHRSVNIGTGHGSSVFQVVESLRSSTGTPFAVDIVANRPGDQPSIVANPDLAARLLGWRARHSLRSITDSAWTAWQHQHG